MYVLSYRARSGDDLNLARRILHMTYAEVGASDVRALLNDPRQGPSANIGGFEG
jgi:hypothetical protein